MADRTQYILEFVVLTFLVCVAILVFVVLLYFRAADPQAELGAKIEDAGARTRAHVSAQVDSIHRNTEVAKASAYAAANASSRGLTLLRSIGKRLGMSADEVDK